MAHALASIAVLLSSTAVAHAETACTRPMIEAAAQSYIAAQAAGDTARMPLAGKVKYRESM